MARLCSSVKQRVAGVDAHNNFLLPSSKGAQDARAFEPVEFQRMELGFHRTPFRVRAG